MEIVTMYEQLGVSRAVYEYGEAVLRDLRPRFDVIDQTAEYNQGKVLAAMQKNRVNATHFAATTGYGYNDDGRDNLERVYADVFHTEAALVRPQITCGTHALAVALSANGPIRPPYAVYFQGGLTWYHAKLGILMSLQKLVEAGLVTLPESK